MSYLNNFRLSCEIMFDIFAPAFLVKGNKKTKYHIRNEPKLVKFLSLKINSTDFLGLFFSPSNVLE